MADIRQPFGSAASNQTPITSVNTGTVADGVTAVEYGDGTFHKTVLTVNSTLPAIAGGAALGVGKLLYTLPAGAELVDGAYMSMALTAAGGNIDADTPDVGVGTVIATGAVSVLSGTATFENIITGQTATDCSGTASVVTTAPTAGTALASEAAGAKTIYFNVADTWAASGETACPISGTITIFWKLAN